MMATVPTLGNTTDPLPPKIDDVEAGDGEQGDMNWATAVDRWASWMRTEGIRERTIELRRYQISHLGDEILRRNPWRVKANDLVSWMAGQDWAPETRKSYRSALNSFYTWGIRAGLTKRNPAAEIKAPRIAPVEPRPIPEEMMRRTLAGADDATRLMMMLMGYAGLRRAEVASFRLDQVDGNVLRVVGKGGKVRSIPLHDALGAALDAEHKRRDAGRRGTGFRYANGAEAGWLFPGRHGGHMTPNAVGKAVAKALPTGWTGHTLRHAFASAAYVESGDVLRVSRLLGHSRPETTARYAQVLDASLHDIVNAIWREAG
ncbi:MAG TPA: tyrosine-type recombinase/integrase [Jiangellaceae bacterium]|nr:tyrosine-type recombinase/integrase [Jiangellaceae bacterium]